MFGKLTERQALTIRMVLAAVWILLIVSLFWDPITIALTRPDNQYSPFRLNRHAGGDFAEQYHCPLYIVDPESGEERVDWGEHQAGVCDDRCLRVQGRCVVERPYSMTPRIFWAMIVPIIPLFLMVFGHEAWRRVCPLSFFSQIPRMLGIQRVRRSINPDTGNVEKKSVIVGPGSFLDRYHWFLQFGILSLCVVARILFVNSDRMALAIFFLGFIGAAIATGYFFGGKTWCSFICPIAPIQKVYSEPRGILESQAHQPKQAITQSMCRRPVRNAPDVGTCVGCVSPCPDVDLERFYWDGIEKPGRRFVYYGYLGFVIAFYSYYTLYAGNWDYYFSGAWTHEEDQLARIWDAGFYVAGYAVPIPKLVAAPLTIGLLIFASYGVGRLMEAAYDAYRRRKGRPLTRDQLLHRTFSIATFLTINTFYMFGGRPNLNLLPELLLGLIDISIVVLSSFWLWRTLGRNALEYRREGLAEGLRRGLRRLNFDFTQLLEGRSLEDLTASETYVLAKTLPGITREQRFRVYKDALRDALLSGYADASSMATIQDLRQNLELSEQEHSRAMMELGIEDSSLLDPERLRSQENLLRLDNFRGAIESLLKQWVQEGTPIKLALQQPKVIRQIQSLQVMYNISEQEQAEVLPELLDERGMLVQDARKWVGQLQDMAHWHGAINSLELEHQTSIALLNNLISQKQVIVIRRLLNVLQVLENSPDGVVLAHALAQLAPEEVDTLLGSRFSFDGHDTDWTDLLHAETLEILESKPQGRPNVDESVFPNQDYQEFLRNPPEPKEVLSSLIRGGEVIFQAPALYILSRFDRAASQEEGRRLLAAGKSDSVSRNLAKVLIANGHRDGGPAAADAPYLVKPATTFRKLLLLYESSFFNHLPVDDLARLAVDAEVRSYAQGSTICRQGEPSDEVLLLSKGTVDVIIRTEGKEWKFVMSQPGETIGEIGVIMHSPRSATVVAGESAAMVVAMKGDLFEAFVGQDSQTAMSFMRLAFERLQRMSSQVSR